MGDLRYAYRDGEDAVGMREALRAANLDAHDETDIDGVTLLVITDADDREHVRELLRTARPESHRRHSVLFEDELAGGA